MNVERVLNCLLGFRGDVRDGVIMVYWGGSWGLLRLGILEKYICGMVVGK